eukprot:6029782-Pyramimonas_sp.AAC.1
MLRATQCSRGRRTCSTRYGQAVDVKGYAVDVKGYDGDVKGYAVVRILQWMPYLRHNWEFD